MRISDWSSDVCSSDLVMNPGISRLLAAMMCVAAAACGKEASNPAPPQLETPVTLSDRASTIRLPVGIPLRDLEKRSEERRVGKEGVRTGRSRWSPYL